MKTTIKLNYQERVEFLTDAIETGSINYWAEIRSLERDNTQFQWIKRVVIADYEKNENEAEKIYILTPATIQEGINILLKPDFKVCDSIRSSLLNNDSDSDTYDAVIQAALFGELVYG